MLTVSEDPLPGNLSIQFIIIFVLILINAFFAASELAILSANPNKIKMLAKKKNKKALLVEKLQSNDTKFLSTIQVGITLAGFFSSATAAVSLSEGFANTLEKINVPYASQIALVVVTLILSYFTLVFGELFPKRIALKSPEKVALLVARPISIIKTIFRPIVFLLSGSCEILVRIFRLKPKEDEKVTEEEVKALISTGVEDGTIEKGEQNLIDAVFIFSDLCVKDIMTPRVDVFMLNIAEKIDLIKSKIKEEKYTRVPIYENSNDNVIGILNIKDILLSVHPTSFTTEDLKSILRTPFIVVENMKIDALFKQFQAKKEHCAIVIDEAGSVSGFVTMEDIIEEIMGNIYDEYDEYCQPITKLDESTYLIAGSLPIQDLNRALNLNIEKESVPYHSVAGYIMYHLQTLPQLGDQVELKEQGITLVVKQIEQRRIEQVELSLRLEDKTE